MRSQVSLADTWELGIIIKPLHMTSMKFGSKRLCWKIPTLPQDSRPFFENPSRPKKTWPNRPQSKSFNTCELLVFRSVFSMAMGPQVVSSLDPDENPDTNIKPGPGHENFQESPWIQDDLKDVKMDVKQESVEETWNNIDLLPRGCCFQLTLQYGLISILVVYHVSWGKDRVPILLFSDEITLYLGWACDLEHDNQPTPPTYLLRNKGLIRPY